MENLEKFFNPKSVAVIGASNEKSKVGFAIVANLLRSRDERKIYPVSLKEKEILGLPAFVSVASIDDEIDLAIICVRADAVPQVLEECGAKKITNVVIISSGFKEMGLSGKALEDKISAIASEKGISLLGPNCLGVINTKNNFNATFSAQVPIAGKLAFLSQSGALGTALIDWANEEGIGFSKFVSLGNETSLTETEFLEYLENDPETSAVLMYLETIKNGPKFLNALKKVVSKKPVVVIKAGMGGHGNLAAMSHTGALAPEASVFISACKQAGAITTSSLAGFFNIIKVLSQLDGIDRPTQRIIILTNGGGPSVVAADLIDRSHSLTLAPLTEEMKEELRKVLPPMAAIGNPIDIIGDALAERYDKALEILSKSENADAVLVILTPQMMTEVEETARVLAKYKNKKIFPVFIGGSSVFGGKKELIRLGLAHFTFPRDVIESLDSIAKGSAKVEAPHWHRKESEESVSSGNKMMEFESALNLLSQYGISVSGKFLKERSGLGEAVSLIGEGPYAMKLISPDAVHKTEAGAVEVGIRSLEEAYGAWDEMERSLKEKNQQSVIEGVLIQKMSSGREVIIGMKRDNTFGPVILFGLGGILAETIKDTATRIAPVETAEAMRMIKSIKGVKILDGLRGQPPVNFDSLAQIIENISRLSVEHPEIKEIDLNPVMAGESGATIVDARVMI